MLDGDCYSPLKVFHHRDRIDDLRGTGRCRPVHVQLVITNRCNQGCSFCAYRTHGYSSSEEFNRHSQIPMADLRKMIGGFKELGVKAVEITGGGEPLVHPDFVAVCEELKARGIQYAVVTNGSLMSNKNLAALLGAEWVRLSLDAAEDVTYAVLRRSRVGVLSKVRSGIRALVEARGRRDYPVVGVGFVVTRNNYQEVPQAAGQAKQDGADNFRISAVFQDGGAQYFHDFYAQAVSLCKEAEALRSQDFRVFNLFGERMGDLQQCSPSHPYCGIQHLVSYVGADQSVYRCCVLAYNQRGLLGSLKGRSFLELWKSKEYHDRMRTFDARECPRCMFNRKNETIRYAINPHPTHVNFL